MVKGSAHCGCVSLPFYLREAAARARSRASGRVSGVAGARVVGSAAAAVGLEPAAVEKPAPVSKVSDVGLEAFQPREPAAVEKPVPVSEVSEVSDVGLEAIKPRKPALRRIGRRRRRRRVDGGVRAEGCSGRARGRSLDGRPAGGAGRGHGGDEEDAGEGHHFLVWRWWLAEEEEVGRGGGWRWRSLELFVL